MGAPSRSNVVTDDQMTTKGRGGGARWITWVVTRAVVAEPSALTKPVALNWELGTVTLFWSAGRMAEVPTNVKSELETARLLRKGCASSPKMKV